MDPERSNKGFRRMFSEDRLTLGIFFPIEAYKGSIPTMSNQAPLARRAEALGFAALWFRDVPLHDPSFGDAGQIFDPWVYLGYMAAQTDSIALATGSIVLPLRHPLHVAKAAASVDQLSGGRLVLGIASGDRPVEFPAFGQDLETRDERFREAFCYFKRALEENFPEIESSLGRMQGVDLIPKPATGSIPILVTGNSRQTCEWIALHSDGWLTYPRPPAVQADLVAKWRSLAGQATPGRFKPFAQSLYIDLVEAADAPPIPIHLGYRLGCNTLLKLLRSLEAIGVNHVILNLKYGSRPASEVLEEIGEEILPHFPVPCMNPAS
jgi:luciferase-type oxidoreductase